MPENGRTNEAREFLASFLVQLEALRQTNSQLVSVNSQLIQQQAALLKQNVFLSRQMDGLAQRADLLEQGLAQLSAVLSDGESQLPAPRLPISPGQLLGGALGFGMDQVLKRRPMK